MKYNIAGDTNIGIDRVHNEDTYEFHSLDLHGTPLHILVVADGTGGLDIGPWASQRVVELCFESFQNWYGCEKTNMFLLESILQTIYTEIESDPCKRGAGAAASVALLYREKLHIINLGNCSIYLLRNKIIEKCTSAHTYLEMLLRIGIFTAKEAKEFPHKNILVKIFGMNPSEAFEKPLEQNDTLFKNRLPPQIIYPPIPLQDQDRILLCTDGIHRSLEQAELGQLLNAAQTMEECCTALIEECRAAMLKRPYKQGGKDDMALICVECISETVEERQHLELEKLLLCP